MSDLPDTSNGTVTSMVLHNGSGALIKTASVLKNEVAVKNQRPLRYMLRRN